ncbi:MAG: hypothetical protein KDA66_21125, partial [Planctomycetaceae bacterium]|nr:hypothetical protein [Planctomycetaceae bacterium]
FSPHTAINAKIVFEPMPAQGHVRISARTVDYELLWGVIGARESLERHPAEVAFYERLVRLAKEHLPKQLRPANSNSVEDALACVARLRRSLDGIESSLSPKQVTEKTEKRAEAMLPDLTDAVRILESLSSKEAPS